MNRRQVFWLSDQPSGCAFPRLAQWHVQLSSPITAASTATDSHRFPYSSAGERLPPTPRSQLRLSAKSPKRQSAGRSAPTRRVDCHHFLFARCVGLRPLLSACQWIPVAAPPARAVSAAGLIVA